MVTGNGPTRHMMLLAPEQHVPANPASTIPPAMVADEHPVASERKPQPNVMPITTRSGGLVKPVPRLINLMMSELVSTTKKPMNVMLKGSSSALQLCTMSQKKWVIHYCRTKSCKPRHFKTS